MNFDHSSSWPPVFGVPSSSSPTLHASQPRLPQRRDDRIHALQSVPTSHLEVNKENVPESSTSPRRRSPTKPTPSSYVSHWKAAYSCAAVLDSHGATFRRNGRGFGSEVLGVSGDGVHQFSSCCVPPTSTTTSSTDGWRLAFQKDHHHHHTNDTQSRALTQPGLLSSSSSSHQSLSVDRLTPSASSTVVSAVSRTAALPGFQKGIVPSSTARAAHTSLTERTGECHSSPQWAGLGTFGGEQAPPRLVRCHAPDGGDDDTTADHKDGPRTMLATATSITSATPLESQLSQVSSSSQASPTEFIGAATGAAGSPALFHQHDLHDRDFTREEVLGQGTYSIVTAATHVPSGHTFALKEISRSRLQAMGMETQLQWEINIHRTLRHPNIVRLYSYYVTRHAICLVLEYCPRGTLMQLVRQSSQGRLPEEKAARYTRHIARGLAYLHHNGMAHRDLKLENVLVDGRGVAKLADFGWSRRMGGGPHGAQEDDHGKAAPTSSHAQIMHSTTVGVSDATAAGAVVAAATVEAVTPVRQLVSSVGADSGGHRNVHGGVNGVSPVTPVRVRHRREETPTSSSVTPSREGRLTVCGTLDYLSPEMVSGQPHTAQTDVWSLGVMMVEMLTGLPPFYHHSTQRTMQAIRDEPPNLTGRCQEDQQIGKGTHSTGGPAGATPCSLPLPAATPPPPPPSAPPLSSLAVTPVGVPRKTEQHEAEGPRLLCTERKVKEVTGGTPSAHTQNPEASACGDQPLHLSAAPTEEVEMVLLSPSVEALIHAMLSKEPDQRPTMDQVLAHPWLQKRCDR